jgi:rubrerythrin
MLDSESRLREATSKIRAKMASATVVIDEPVEVQEPSQKEHPEAEMKQMKMEQKEESEPKPESASGVYTCPMDSHSHIVQMGPGKCPECGMKLVPAEETSGRTVFVCPMPEDSVVSAEPGRCPKCGMELVEMTFDEEKHEGHMHEMPEQTEEKSTPDEITDVYTCPMDSHSHILQMGPGECPECGMKLLPAEETSGRTAFVCPIPEDSVVSGEAGRCPKCGMKLVEKTNEGVQK